MESMASKTMHSATASSSAISNKSARGNGQFKQRRLKSARLIGEYEKPWIEKSPYRKREIWDKIIFFGCLVGGMAIGGVLCYFNWANVPKHDYCLVFDENFNNTANWRDQWYIEEGVGGFGVGSFDWTSDDPKNSYVDSTGLHIVPTMTLETTNITLPQMLNGYTVNLTAAGVCTANLNECNITSNATTSTIINPVRSARLSTKGKHSITYGRIEVVAKLPKGDWLWPAIWMLPETSVYGEWPLSGEIDILESRGNDRSYGTGSAGGRQSAKSGIHWGMSFITDMFLQTTYTASMRRGDYAQAFHTYGLEWSEDYLYTYIDNRLAQVTYVGFGAKLGTLWQRGKFSQIGFTPNQDPWSQTGRYNTPFDQPFYLVLNVAVGGTAGFFPDSVGEKPWVDGSESAALDFWKANSTWLPTWGEGDLRGMTVKSVKMWQQGKCS